MAVEFDPYHKWLGIPPAEQPANFYRLLALNPFESDPDVIEAAADARIAHLRSLQTGKFGDLTQPLLNEVTSAGSACLTGTKSDVADAALALKWPPDTRARRQNPSATPSPSKHRPPPKLPRSRNPARNCSISSRPTAPEVLASMRRIGRA